MDEQEIIKQGQAELERKRSTLKPTLELQPVAVAIRDHIHNYGLGMVASTMESNTALAKTANESPYEPYDVRGNVERILSARGVPANFLSAQLERPESLDDADHGYFLYGPVGSGKTYRAVAIMREIILRKFQAYLIGDIVRGIYDARFVPVTDLLLRIKAAFTEGSEESEGDVIYRMASPALLVLDDLGVEKVSDWTLQTLYTIFDIRSRERRQTIVTSNLSLDDLGRRMQGDRIPSRIRGMCKIFPVTGSDRRLSR